MICSVLSYIVSTPVETEDVHGNNLSQSSKQIRASEGHLEIFISAPDQDGAGAASFSS